MIFKEWAQNFALSYAHNTMEKSLQQSLNINIDQKVSKPKTPSQDKSYMLYAHVPFCHTFCPYCSFHKYYYDQESAKRYFINLRDEMKQVKKSGFDFTSMYVGGGTTLINEEELEKTLILARELFSIKEISCESDPNHIDPTKLANFKGLIDRLSVGVQSFDDEILRKVSRYDKFGSQKILIEKLNKAVGILPILSLDLIFNFPFQTSEELLKDIQIAKNISSQQITFYPLMKSPITRDAIARSLGTSAKDNEREFYEIICSQMGEYYHNNAWSFSKTQSTLRDEYVGNNHEYVGVGSGAFSFLDGELLINAFDLCEYEELVKNQKSTVIATCDFKEDERVKYLFLTELFDGEINLGEFKRQNGIDLKKSLFVHIALMRAVGAIKIKNDTIKTTEFGRYLCVTLMKDFYTQMDRVRALFRDKSKPKNTQNGDLSPTNKELLKKLA